MKPLRRKFVEEGNQGTSLETSNSALSSMYAYFPHIKLTCDGMTSAFDPAILIPAYKQAL